MSPLERCAGCGRTTVLFSGGTCLRCGRPEDGQLSLAFDADDLDHAQRDAVEAAVLHQEGERAREASMALPCRCPSSMLDDDTCAKCGHAPVWAVAA